MCKFVALYYWVLLKRRKKEVGNANGWDDLGCLERKKMCRTSRETIRCSFLFVLYFHLFLVPT